LISVDHRVGRLIETRVVPPVTDIVCIDASRVVVLPPATD